MPANDKTGEPANDNQPSSPLVLAPRQRIDGIKQGRQNDDAKDFERADLEAPDRRKGFSEPLDVAARNRPTPAVGDVAGRADRVDSAETPPTSGKPYFDVNGRFIHICRCGTPAVFGVGVNLRAGKLGTWYCASCKPQPEEGFTPAALATAAPANDNGANTAALRDSVGSGQQISPPSVSDRSAVPYPMAPGKKD